MLLSFMLVAGLTSGFQAPTDERGMATPDRVRGTNASMRAVIDEGCRRSPVFAGLVRDVEASKFVVYVDAVPALGDGMHGALLHHTNTAQYLRIHLRRGLQLRDQVAVLAHELQHVREVIQAGINAHAEDMEKLFRRIGDAPFAGGWRQQFETAAALHVGKLVSADLRTMQRPNTGFCRAGTQ